MKRVEVDRAGAETFSDEMVQLGVHLRVEKGVAYRCMDATGYEVGRVDIDDGLHKLAALTTFWRDRNAPGAAGIALVTGFSVETARAVAGHLVAIADEIEREAAQEAAQLLRRVAGR